MVAALRIIDCLLLVGSVLWFIAEAGKEETEKKNYLMPSLLLIFFVVGLLSWGLVFLPPEKVAVVISPFRPGGIAPYSLGPGGLHFIVPFFERVQTYPISRQTFTMAKTPSEGEEEGILTVEARTLDEQRIFVDSSVIYEINPAQVVSLHIRWQHRYEQDLVLPETRGIIRDVVSQYRVDEVVSTKRYEVANEISRRLEKVLAANGLVLVDFVLRDITFTEEYAQSIEQKQIAEQQALQARFVVEQKKQEAEQARQVAQGQADAAVIQAKGEAEARLIRARAEAEALKLIAEALATNPNLLTYEYISKLAPGIRVMLVPSNAPFILPAPEIETAQ